jgi:hypothetical protein
MGAWEPYNGALVQALACGQPWSEVRFWAVGAAIVTGWLMGCYGLWHRQVECF